MLSDIHGRIRPCMLIQLSTLYILSVRTVAGPGGRGITPPPERPRHRFFRARPPPPHPPSRHVPMAHTPGNPRSPSQSLCCFPCKMNIISVTKFITISVTEYVISVTISFRPLYSAQFMCCGQVSPTVLFKERKHYIIALHCILSL